MVYVGHTTESIYEQIPLYENTIKDHKQLTAKLIQHGTTEPIYEDARNLRTKLGPCKDPRKDKAKRGIIWFNKRCSYVKCCVVVVTTVTVVVLIPLVYFLIDVAVKHKHLKGKYDQLKAETDKKYKMTTTETKMVEQAMLKMSEHKYEILTSKMNEKYEILKKEMSSIYKDVNLKKDCLEVYKVGHCKSGIHSIRPNAHIRSIRVYCDQDTDGGGWTVFQRRVHSRTSFERSWSDYKLGFGDLAESFWLGNENLHMLTNLVNTSQELRIDLEDWNGIKVYAKYTVFVVGDEASQFKLKVGGYSGNAGNGIGDLHGMTFSTKDKDTDKCSCDCSKKYGNGGWWLKSCFGAHLNSKYCTPRDQCARCHNINWQSFRNCSLQLKKSEMKMRSYEDLSG